MKIPYKLSLLAFILFFGCKDKKESFIKELSTDVCNCFSKQPLGSVDDKLSGCLNSEEVNFYDRMLDLHKVSESDAIEYYDTLLAHYTKDIFISMIYDCDEYYVTIDSMYSNMYPQIQYSSIEKEYNLLKDSLLNKPIPDSVGVLVLHQQIALLTKARKFDEALLQTEVLTNKYNKESETYWVKAYIYYIKKEYDKALMELDKDIANGNIDAKFIKALTYRKKKL